MSSQPVRHARDQNLPARGLMGLLPTPRILAVVGFTAILGIGVGLAIAPGAWAVDIGRNLAAARDLASGRYGDVEGYLYTPLAAAVTIPVTFIPVGAAVWGWLVVRIAIVVAGIIHETPERTAVERALLAAAALLFVPTMYDLLLGNVNLLLAGAVAVIAWRRDSWASGILLGIILATVPKPQLIPVLVWMLCYRRRALATSITVAGATTLAGLLILGFDSYRTFFDLGLHAAGVVENGNLALTALDPAVAIPLSVLAVAAFLVSLRRGELAGGICAVCLGLLIAPYTMAYGVVVLLPAIRPMARLLPRATFVLSIWASLAVVTVLAIWLAAVMAAALATPRDAVWSSEQEAA